MPAIRDSSFAFETLTTDAGITIPVPTNSANDLLIAFVMGDTGTPTWTLPTGWTQLFAQNNTCSTLCAYKISNGSEPSTVTFGANVNETYNGTILSIMDVDTTNPFGSPSVFNNTTQAAAFKFNMQTITTNRNNALCIVFYANSSAGVPSFIENKGMSIVAADGAAESMGVGWFFMPTIGTTPNNITCSNVVTGPGVKAVIQVVPPLSGATVIPTYIAADNCTYLEPINGLVSYNGNTALAPTADTNFGTTLGGIAAADATVAGAPDTGINSFHSSGQLTSVANETTMYGAELVFAAANRPNITSKNLLCHVQASTPTQLQRLPNIASDKGIWFGVRSGSGTDFKIWQVLGTDSPDAVNRPVPIIINEQAGNVKASAGTLDPSNILAVGFWVGGKAVGTTVWQFMSLWLMDSTVVCGGIAAFPVNISGIVKAIADSHERKSALLQGSNQMLLLQDLQLGDGGTHPIYLDLNATAIEFPSLYNKSNKQVKYNSVENKIGITYYAGASDTIKHRNSVISSPSRYKWGLHPSSSTSATYDFSGLSVIGAGTITLARAITIRELTINDYSTLDVSNATLVDCTILNVPAANDSLTVNASTKFDGCFLNVSTVTAGNRWVSLANPSIFEYCEFTGGGGHAIRITTPGTYTLKGNQFTGFGANGSTGAAIFNDSGGAVTLNITDGGNTPTVRNGTGASTTVVNSVTVRVKVLDVNTGAPIENARVFLATTPGGVGIFNNLTNASGIVENTAYNYTADVNVTGRVRKGSTAPYYKTSPITGTITSSGFQVTVFLIPDE
jgi:hypothetical protein